MHLWNIWDFNDGRKFNFLIVRVTTPCRNISWSVEKKILFLFLFLLFFYGASICFRAMACLWRYFKTIQFLRSVDEAPRSTPKREGYSKFCCPASPSKSGRHFLLLCCHLHRLQILSFKQAPSLGCTVFSKVCFSVLATLKFTYFLNKYRD
jgi:hypothetical protein